MALVDRTLDGAPLESLGSRTADAIEIEPLYGPDKVGPTTAFDRAARGAGSGWDIRAPVRQADCARANAEIREALDGGATSILAVVDPSGARGVAIGAAADLERLLEGAPLELAPLALDAGFHGRIAAEWLASAAKASPTVRLCFHLDPLGAFAVAGSSPGPIEAHMGACASLAARLAAPYPQASLFLASGVSLHEAGASEACEVAFAAACALAYARALEPAGLSPAQAFGRIVLGMATDGDCLVSIAKLRATRMVWRRITSACGATATAKIEARSSRRMLTRIDPWTNLVRVTAAGFAAAAGGADAIVLGAFTDALGPPAALARRLARNTGLILVEEAHIGRVIDPAGGSWAFEALSTAIARAAWTRLQKIEAAGGAARALGSGLIESWTIEGREDLQRRLRAGESKIVGVTVFRRGAPQPVEIETARPIPVAAPDPSLPGSDSRCPPLAPVALEELAA